MSPFIMRRCRLSNEPLEFIGRHMLRDADRQELSVRGDPGKALSIAVRSSDDNVWVATSRVMREMLAIFGWVRMPLNKKGRIIWMVGTNELMKYKLPFYRVSKRIINHWLDEAGMLHNFIDTRNTVHIEWLKHLGFSFPKGSSMNVGGVPFQYFVKEK